MTTRLASSGSMDWTRIFDALVARPALIGAAVLWTLTASAAAAIHGAGATFPAPVYNAWAAAYQQSNAVKISYDAVGSGAGIDRIRQRQVDFGASDAPLSTDDLAGSRLMQFPVVIGGVVPVINITGIKPGHLQLTGALLADIYLGRIKKWNDAAIAALNPQLSLPNTNITVVYRRDPSGTSQLWTDYLARSSADWRSSVGVSLTPKWPTGVGGAGNEGVASHVQRTRFAIGYVEYIYSRKHHLSDVALRNHSGRFVQAGRSTFRAAAGGNTTEVLRFFDWALHPGEPIARTLDYVPVPRTVVDALPALRGTLRDSSGKRLWPGDG